MTGRFRRSGAAGVLLLLSVLPLRGDITLPAVAPPQADARAAVVRRGERIIIPLRGHHSGTGTVTFWIVERPEHGALSELRLLGDNRATIVYEHDGSNSSPEDRFTYAVKTSADLVSAPAEVRIAVQEPPAHLQVPERIAFGAVMAGERLARPLDISNDGGGVLAGQLTVSAPWMLAEASYRVAAGKSKKLALIFAPNEGRDYVGKVTLTGEDGSQFAVALEGHATSPVDLAPEVLQIDSQPDENQPREGSFSLTNQTGQSLDLTFESGREIERIAPARLKPRETRTIPVVILAPRTVPVSDEVKVQGDGFMARLSVESEAAVANTETVSAVAAAPVDPHATPTAGRGAVPVVSTPSNASLQDASVTPTPSPAGPGVIPVHVVHLNRSSWELSWKAPKSSSAIYRVQERQLSLDGAGELQTSWHTLAPSAISSSGDSGSLRIENLAEDRLHVLKLTAFAADGAARWESPLLSLSPPKGPDRGEQWWLLLLGSVLVGLIIWRRRLEGPG